MTQSAQGGDNIEEIKGNLKNLVSLMKKHDGKQLITNEELTLAVGDMVNALAQYRSATAKINQDTKAINEETRQTLNKAMLTLQEEFKRILENVRTENASLKLDEIRQEILDTVREIMPKDGKDGLDADEEAIFERLLERIPDPIKPVLDNGDQIVEKINSSKGKIKKERVEGLEQAILNGAANAVNALPVTTPFVNGKRAKNININGATVNVVGDTANVDVSGMGGTPGGSDTQVQFNDGGSFGGDADLTWDKTNNILTVSSSGNGFIQTSGDGTLKLRNSGGDGYGVDLMGSNGITSGSSGGSINLFAGSASPTGISIGGDIGFYPANGNNGGRDGYVFIQNYNSGKNAIFDTDLLTDDRTYAFPDKDGTFAMLSDITASGIVRSVNTTSAGATMGSAAGTDYVYLVAGAHNMVLPDALSNSNKYTVRNNHTASVTVSTTSSQNINQQNSGGAIVQSTSVTLESGRSYDFISNGTDTWNII